MLWRPGRFLALGYFTGLLTLAYTSAGLGQPVLFFVIMVSLALTHMNPLAVPQTERGRDPHNPGSPPTSITCLLRWRTEHGRIRAGVLLRRPARKPWEDSRAALDNGDKTNRLLVV